MELTANFHYHFVSSFTNGFHGHSAKHKRQGGTDEYTDQNNRIQQIDSFQFHNLRVCGEQSQRGQRGRTDGKSFADSSSSIADGVQGISDFTNACGQFSHFRNAACVIGNRTVSVNRYGDAGGCQHADCGQGDTVNAQCRISHAAHYKERDEYRDADEYDQRCILR